MTLLAIFLFQVATAPAPVVVQPAPVVVVDHTSAWIQALSPVLIVLAILIQQMTSYWHAKQQALQGEKNTLLSQEAVKTSQSAVAQSSKNAELVASTSKTLETGLHQIHELVDGHDTASLREIMDLKQYVARLLPGDATAQAAADKSVEAVRRKEGVDIKSASTTAATIAAAPPLPDARPIVPAAILPSTPEPVAASVAAAAIAPKAPVATVTISPEAVKKLAELVALLQGASAPA